MAWPRLIWRNRRAFEIAGDECIVGLGLEDSDMTDAMEVPVQVREFAEKSVEQVEKAFDAFMEAAQKSAAIMPNAAMSEKVLSFTVANMKSAFDHVRKLIQAKDIQEALQAQTEFLKEQSATVTEQMKELGAGVRGAAEDAMKKIST
jgi:phasin